MPDAIVLSNLGKQFRRYPTTRPQTLQETVARGVSMLRAADKFWALRNLSFTVASGQTLGLIGPNGAGKSTLLRLIGGVGRPDEGSVEVHGRAGGLLELGAGFHPDLTGRENVFINGVISGLTRREVARRFDDIVAFSELEDEIDSPLRTYSTGMRMRLGFSVAAHTDSKILLIDEVLAVGDHSFRKKCFARIDRFKAEGRTILLASHNIDQIKNLCDDAVWLQKGRLVAQGRPDSLVDAYVEAMEKISEDRLRSQTQNQPA